MPLNFKRTCVRRYVSVFPVVQLSVQPFNQVQPVTGHNMLLSLTPQDEQLDRSARAFRPPPPILHTQGQYRRGRSPDFIFYRLYYMQCCNHKQKESSESNYCIFWSRQRVDHIQYTQVQQSMEFQSTPGCESLPAYSPPPDLSLQRLSAAESSLLTMTPRR